MATKPELRRAVANSYIKAGDYNYNFDQLNNYIENGIADNAISIYENDREYSKGQWVLANTSNGKGLYESQVDGNKGNSLLDTTYWKKVNLGSGLELCDIGMALYVDETKGLRRYLNGQIVDINTNTQAFLNRLLEIKNTNPDYFATEENWQAEATLNIDGCVYKFVINYADDGETVVSVRLPKYPDYVEINAGGTLPVVGNGMSLGLTDGTNNVGLIGSNDWKLGSRGRAFGKQIGTLASDGIVLANDTVTGVTTDPTKSGIQTTLKQTKLKMRYFIQIATGSETENNIINDIELNNPYSLFDSKYSDHELNNLSWLKSEGQWNAKTVYTDAYDKLLKVQNGTETVEGLSVKLSTETYTDYDFVLNTADETFRLPLKNHTADDGNSVLTLYFYVGETVQNANLIDAGRIGEQLANKVNMLQASSAGMPSSKYIDLTLGASDSTYTAPANGWYSLVSSSVGVTGQLHNITKNIGNIGTSVSGISLSIDLPAKKGDVVRLRYTTATNTQLKFLYAEGSK